MQSKTTTLKLHTKTRKIHVTALDHIKTITH